MEQNQKIVTLFKKYLEGQCSPEELDLFFKYVGTSQGKKVLNELLDKEAVDQFYKDMIPTPEVSNQIFRRLDAQIEEKNKDGNVLTIFRKLATTRIAATLTGILLVGAVLFYFIKSSSLKHQTAYGEISTVLLPDSSTVILNGNSLVRYAGEWQSGESREVWVQGEAYFSVKHSINRQKFIVHADNADIEVVGTTFNVNSRHKKIEVVLNTGRIRLKRTDGEITTRPDERYVMNPGDFVSFSTDQRKIERKKVDPEQYIAWTRGMLVFDETPVADIIQSLKDNLGMKIEVEDENIKQYKYSGTIPVDNVDIFFHTLSKTLDIVIEKDADRLIIKREKNDPRPKDATP